METNIKFYFKNFEPTDAIRNYIITKLEHSQKVFHHIDGVDVRLNSLKNVYTFEITIHADSSIFHIQKDNIDMYAAIDETLDSLHISADKHRKKISRAQSRDIVHHIPTSRKIMVEDPEISISIFDASDKPISDNEAILQLREQRYLFLLYFSLTSRSHAVVFSKPDGKYSIFCGDPHYNYVEKTLVEDEKNVFSVLSFQPTTLLRPMPVTKAAKILDRNHLRFLTFINKDTGVLNVIFESNDGDIIVKRAIPVKK